MGRPEGSNRVGQLELVDGPDEVTEGLGVGLDRAVRLALHLAGLEVEGDKLVEYWQVQPPLIRWSHTTHSAGEGSQAKRPAGLSDAEESLADGEGHRAGPGGDNVERGGVNPNPNTPGRDA